MDTMSKTARSGIMGKIKSQETKLEKSFRKLLWNSGIRYRKNNNKYFGKPDILIKKNKTVIFIDSCFWHGCLKHLRMPSSNKKYWETKISRNKKRDRAVNSHYKKLGWKIIRIWEHDLNKKTKLEKVIANLR